jgi:hypothetical protein
MARLRFHHRRREQVAVNAGVEEFWFGPFLGLANTNFVHGNAPADIALRIVEIPRENRLGWADHLAGGLIAHFHSRCVEVALCRRVAIRVDIKSVVRARLHAGLATDAALVVEVDDAIVPAKKRHRRTDLDARSIVAVVAAKHGKVAPGLWINALLDILHPGPIHSDGDVVLFFACHRASMTADATVLIDDKSVAH